MKFCRSVLYNAKKILIKRSMKYTHTILIGENASGKSELLREYVEELLSEGENVYYIDSVNRYFDIAKVSTPYSNIEKSCSEIVVKTRMERKYFNLKDTFSLFGTLNDRIELIYLEYEQRLQMMLKNFLGFSFEMKGIKEKEVWFESEAEGVLSSGIQALVRIFLELLYLNDMKKNHVHIVIDEIDEFLSPSNSGKILDFLITQFPNLNFLVSTHSIDLVKNAKKCNILILYNADIEVVDADDDVLQSRFQASNRYMYSEQEIEFMEDHIKRFRLNGEREKTKQLVAFLKDTIDCEGRYTKMEYNHYIVELFMEKLQGKTREEILKICKLLYIKAVLKFQTE